LPLPADWFGPPPRSDFLVVRSRADAQAKRRLLSVASAVRDKLPGQALGAPQALDAEAAVASEAALLDATRWLCEAQVAVFDATGFEPAVMLLLGIRAVVRRGVTILSIGGDYAVGDPLGVPFNLMDANIVAHSARQAQLLDERLHPVPMLLTRIVRALEALESPHHVDLPVYEAVRRLPVARRGVRPPEDGVLVLCSFDPGYQQRNWPVLSEALKNQWENLKARLASTATPAGALGVARSFELNSPQLVSRAIYEEMRRARSCVVDLTGWSDAVLFELGVRLVVSPHPTACIVERQAADAETDPARLALLRLLVPETLRYDLGQDVLVEPAWGCAYGPMPRWPPMARPAARSTAASAKRFRSRPNRRRSRSFSSCSTRRSCLRARRWAAASSRWACTPAMRGSPRWRSRPSSTACWRPFCSSATAMATCRPMPARARRCGARRGSCSSATRPAPPTCRRGCGRRSRPCSTNRS
jgi:hypothetical protein